VGRAQRLGATLLAVVVAGALFAACGAPIVRAACDGKLVLSVPGTIQSTAIVEPSGLVASRQNAGTLWLLNDSGDTARLHAISESGAARATYTLTGATAVDWEALALSTGPVSGRAYLYAADIGDNQYNRSSIVVYRVAEPVITTTGAQTLTGVDVLTLRFPDGPNDAEAFFVDPRTGEMYIIQKSLSGGPVGVYRAPANLAAGSTTVMTRAGTLSLPTGSLMHAVTSADITQDGDAIAVRTYGAVRLWYRNTDQTVATALTAAPCAGPIPVEGQGETIGFRPDGRAYYTVTEGRGSEIHRFTIAP